MKIVPVILSGGVGTRLWPLSRANYPKQFLNLSSNRHSLMQETIGRINNPAIFAPPLVIGNAEHRFIIAEQLLEMGMELPIIILEPEGRNTAPALTIAALMIQEVYGKDALMLAMPSDHVMEQPEAFLCAVGNAAEQAKNGSLMAFGIKPTHAETAYGYIRTGNPINKNHYICEIAKFVEKPDKKTAQGYIDSAAYLWNSGIFLFATVSYMEEIHALHPEIAELCAKSLAARKKDLDFIRLDEASFKALPAISIDYAIMEKTKKGAVIEVDCRWSDIGSWDALWKIHPHDLNGNVIRGKACPMHTKDSYIRSEGAVICTLGVENLIVVSTKDAVLVAHKDRTQEIKALVEKIAVEHKALADIHPKVYRPWGYYESIDTGDRYQVKHLSIKPREKLSLQMHHHRTEHWVVVRGIARATLDDKEFILSENQSFYIPIGAKHRLENAGEGNLEIIEIQSGSYLGEDDIVRFEDRYGR